MEIRLSGERQTVRFRPLPRSERPRPPGAARLAGGSLWFDTVVAHRRDAPPERLGLAAVPAAALARLTAPRPGFCGFAFDRPRLMAVLNVTPDSFSDGGLDAGPEASVARGRALAAAGADILDIGGESTRPGAHPVSAAEEIARVVPVIEGLRGAGVEAPISIDTRKAAVAEAAFAAGADMLNDVSALGFDSEMAALLAARGRPVCLMHAQGDPETMQDAPAYDDVLLDVCDHLEARLEALEAIGVPRARVAVDPGIGFGKTLEHNLALIRGLAILHGLGCPVLLGASRKRFIGTLGDAPTPADRAPGSIAAALEGLRQGAQMIRVHDVAETRQAVAVWTALNA